MQDALEEIGVGSGRRGQEKVAANDAASSGDGSGGDGLPGGLGDVWEITEDALKVGMGDEEGGKQTSVATAEIDDNPGRGEIP